MVDTFFSFPFLSLLLGINWRLRIDNNIAVSKEEREEKGGVRVLPATDEREIDEGFVMAQNVSKSAVAQPLSHAPAHNYSHLACSGRTTSRSRSCISTSQARGPGPQNKDTTRPRSLSVPIVVSLLSSDVELFSSDRYVDRAIVQVGDGKWVNFHRSARTSVRPAASRV